MYMIKAIIDLFRTKVLRHDICWHCTHWFKATDIEPTSSDRWICDVCYDEVCHACHDEIAEVETKDGDYICTDCHAGEMDAAYDYYKDSLYEQHRDSSCE